MATPSQGFHATKETCKAKQQDLMLQGKGTGDPVGALRAAVAGKADLRGQAPSPDGWEKQVEPKDQPETAGALGAALPNWGSNRSWASQEKLLCGTVPHTSDGQALWPPKH